jgi:FKBP-type peptidyl-prolyl cis-trans isomerase
LFVVFYLGIAVLDVKETSLSRQCGTAYPVIFLLSCCKDKVFGIETVLPANAELYCSFKPMKKIQTILVFLFLLAMGKTGTAADRDSTIRYSLPDSVKAVQFMAEFNVGAAGKKKYTAVGLSTSTVKIYFDNYYKGRSIRFHPVGLAKKTAKGADVTEDLKYGYFNFTWNWKENTPYKLMIAMAADSISSIELYSGYVFLPELNKWKLIGTYQFSGKSISIREPAVYCRKGRKFNTAISFTQTWIQRSNGSWKNLQATEMTAPVISLSGHADSAYQLQKDIRDIKAAVESGKTDGSFTDQGLFFKILQQGNGKQVALTDTVTVHYKGSLFSDGSVFDQTNEKPARFPLNRLITGWQLGVPLLKVGGKIRLVIPSNMAYSIRTRSAKIPPNSILVFEVEVLEAKSAGE